MKNDEAVLLVNLGNPDNLDEMYSFLRNMFNDKHILKIPLGIRQMVSFFISKSRYKKSWKKYELIGGSNLKKDSIKIANELEKKSSTKVYTAFSYSKPYIEDSLKKIIDDGVKNLKVLTMFPQNSYTTTKSIFTSIDKFLKDKDINYSFINEYYNNDEFINYWAYLIDNHIKNNNIDKENLLLLFCAHSIPKYCVDKKKDSYINSIEEMSKKIASSLNYRYDIAYQSKLGPVEWVGPDIDEYIKIILEKEKNIILLPISFITECLETIFDLDINLVDIYKKEGLQLSRVKLPGCHDKLVSCYSDLIK